MQPATPLDAGIHATQRAEMKEFLRRCALNFPSQKEVLAGMAPRAAA